MITLIQYSFITVDILCNAFSDHFSDHILRQLSIYVIQDLCLVLSLILLLLYYFNVEDIAAAVARATQHGGTLTHGPSEVPGGQQIVHFLDTQGAAFGMVGPAK